MNGLKSYHAMKSEQSRTFATSLKEDVVDSLRNMLKKEVVEAKKYLNVGKKTDLDMKIILEKIETVHKYVGKIVLILLIRQEKGI